MSYCPLLMKTDNFYDVLGLSQKVVDFLCYKKTIQCLQSILPVNSSILSALYRAKFEGKISDNEVCALILPAICLAHRRMPFELLRTMECSHLYLAWLCVQSSSNNKCGMHLAGVCAIFKSDFNAICTVGFPQPVFSARQRTFVFRLCWRLIRLPYLCQYF